MLADVEAVSGYSANKFSVLHSDTGESKLPIEVHDL